MTLLLRFIAGYAGWIYLFCAIGVLLCLRSIQKAKQERDASLFTLEKEAAASKAQRAIGVMVGILLMAGATAFIDLSVVPRMDLPSSVGGSRTPLPLPTPTYTLVPATPTPL